MMHFSTFYTTIPFSWFPQLDSGRGTADPHDPPKSETILRTLNLAIVISLLLI